MSYVKKTWVTGEVVYAGPLNNMENGIAENDAAVTELTGELENKANTDGYYEDLTAGLSDNLTTKLGITDECPYNFRATGSGNSELEVGTRADLKKIVGASVGWNQVWNGGNAQTPTVATITDLGNHAYKLESVATGDQPYRYGIKNETQVQQIVGHKYLFFATITPDFASSNYSLFIGTKTRTFTQSVAANQTAIIAHLDKVDEAITTNFVFHIRDMKDQPVGASCIIKNLMCINLTLALGSTIADYVYTLEQATAGAGVAWLKTHFPKMFGSYQPYDAGSIKSVTGLSAHVMTGFNQWDEEWEVGSYDTTTGAKKPTGTTIRNKNAIKILPNTAYYFKISIGSPRAFYYDESGTYLGTVLLNRNAVFTTPNNAYYMCFHVAGTTYDNDICINLHYDGERDGEFEAYKEWTYPLDDSLTLRGILKLDASNNLYADGDEYEADGTVTRRYGIVDLGTLDWTYVSSSNPYFQATLSGAKPSGQGLKGNILINKFYAVAVSGSNADKIVAISTANSILYIRDLAYTDATTFKQMLTDNDVKLVYELATPTTETADPYTESQIVDNWGTEEFVSTSIVPVGNETVYRPDLKAKLEAAPYNPSDEGKYVLQITASGAEYVELPAELPAAPGTDGTYRLKATVADGVATYTWEVEE